MKNQENINCSIKIDIKVIFSFKTVILTLLKLLKPIKTDRKSMIDPDSPNIMSKARLECTFMPKQGPRSKGQGPRSSIHDPILVRP